MKTQRVSSLCLTLVFIFSSSSATSSYGHQNFLQCLSQEFHNYSSITNLVYIPTNSSFISILRSPIKNLRFTTESTPQPQAIITPEYESQIPPLIRCAKKSELEIRTRSGGHDFEGLSSVAQVPFVIIDFINLSEVTLDIEKKTAWIESGATLGTLYYKIAEKSSTLGFPGGIFPTIGVAGHFSGGGYGSLLRKYGLAADHVIDVRIVDVNGRILDRRSMGEDLFWAIRGGGGASFGVIVSWKVQLVDVPERVIAFRVGRTLEQNATAIVHRWQYVAPEIDRDLFIGIMIRKTNSTINGIFYSLFLGDVDRLMLLMQEKFPELGLVRQDCIEMSWLRSTIYLPGFPIETPIQIMLQRTLTAGRAYTKIKSNYVQKPITESGFQGVWNYLKEPVVGAGGLIIMVPYGGRMGEILESAIPFPHRAGNLYSLTHYSSWDESEAQNSDKYLSWSRRLYDYLTPFVATNPRSAYINYRDFDLGVNNVQGKTSYTQASVWGKKYLKKNFDRLVRVKTKVDPTNFFRFEQSIPPFYPKWT